MDTHAPCGLNEQFRKALRSRGFALYTSLPRECGFSHSEIWRMADGEFSATLDCDHEALAVSRSIDDGAVTVVWSRPVPEPASLDAALLYLLSIQTLPEDSPASLPQS